LREQLKLKAARELLKRGRKAHSPKWDRKEKRAGSKKTSFLAKLRGEFFRKPRGRPERG